MAGLTGGASLINLRFNYPEAGRRQGSAQRLGKAGVAALVLFGGMLAGCATTPESGAKSDPQAIEKKVTARAEARWQALIKGDLDAAYAFLSPATRSTVSVQSFRSRIKPGLWTDVKVESLSCKDQVCEVSLKIGYKYPRITGDQRLESLLSEKWLVEDGEVWYFYAN